MRIETVTVSERAVTGQYEHEEITVVAHLEEGDHALGSILSIKKTIRFALDKYPDADMQNVGPGSESVKEPEPNPVAPATEKKTKAKKEKAPVVAPPPTPDPVSEEQAEEQEPTPAPVEEEKPKVKVKVKGKNSPYDRTNDIHKKLVTEILDKNYKGWKTKPDKAVEASKSLQGTDFLDAEGSILPSFVSKLEELMA